APGIDHFILAWTIDLDDPFRHRAGCIFVTDPDRLARLERMAFVLGGEEPTVRLRHVDGLRRCHAERGTRLRGRVVVLRAGVALAVPRRAAKSHPRTPAQHDKETQQENVHASSPTQLHPPNNLLTIYVSAQHQKLRIPTLNPYVCSDPPSRPKRSSY